MIFFSNNTLQTIIIFSKLLPCTNIYCNDKQLLKIFQMSLLLHQTLSSYVSLLLRFGKKKDVPISWGRTPMVSDVVNIWCSMTIQRWDCEKTFLFSNFFFWDAVIWVNFCCWGNWARVYRVITFDYCFLSNIITRDGGWALNI